MSYRFRCYFFICFKFLNSVNSNSTLTQLVILSQNLRVYAFQNYATVEIHLYTYQVRKFSRTLFFNSTTGTGCREPHPLPLPWNPHPGPYSERLEKAFNTEQIISILKERIITIA